jgi:hypothetical protein
MMTDMFVFLTITSLTFRGAPAKLRPVKACWQAVLGAGLALILVNPVCICRAESMPAAEAAPDSQGSCCSKSTEPSGDAPGPFAPGPCECEAAVNLGLTQAKVDSSIPIAAVNRIISFEVKPAFTFAPLAFILPAVAFRGPPLRHLHSVYRL